MFHQAVALGSIEGHSFGILEILFQKPKVVDRGNGTVDVFVPGVTLLKNPGPFLHINHAVTKKGHALAYVQFEGIDEGKNGDDGKNTHRHTQKGKQSTEQIGTQRTECKGSTFKKEDENLSQPME